MTTDLEKEREAFEAWARRQLLISQSGRLSPSGEIAKLAWQARAALAAPAAPQAHSGRRPSQEWYASKIQETLDDDFSVGHHHAAPQEQPSDATCALCRGTGRIGIPGATCPGCDGARQSIACAPKPKLDDGAVARLKLVCRKLGLESAIPDDLYSEPGALFTILGQIRSRVDALLAAPQGREDAGGQIEHLDVENHRLRRALQKVMARLANLLDEDQFGNIESIMREAGVEPPKIEALVYTTPQPAGRDAREVPDEP